PVRAGRGARRDRHPHLGARRRLHPGVRIVLVRRRLGRGAERPLRPRSRQGPDAGWRAHDRGATGLVAPARRARRGGVPGNAVGRVRRLVVKRVCVFCGSSEGARPAYADAARRLGAELVARKLGLVYAGCAVGLMGVVADAVLEAGGEAIGIIPEPLVARELAHTRLTELRIVGSMHERKATMASLVDGFIALPGGLGTLEETFEILTWAQLGIHAQPVGVLDVDAYWDGLRQLLAHAVAERFVRPEYASLLLFADEPAALLD